MNYLSLLLRRAKKKNRMHEGSAQRVQSYSEFSALFYEIKLVVIHHPTDSEQSVLIQFVSAVTLIPLIS